MKEFQDLDGKRTTTETLVEDLVEYAEKNDELDEIEKST